MKMLKRLLSLSRWRRQKPEAPEKAQTIPQALVDREEFARLIGSVHVEDLRILSRRLSTQPKAHV
jgi:hypothetical protein